MLLVSSFSSVFWYMDVTAAAYLEVVASLVLAVSVFFVHLVCVSSVAICN